MGALNPEAAAAQVEAAQQRAAEERAQREGHACGCLPPHSPEQLPLHA